MSRLRETRSACVHSRADCGYLSDSERPDLRSLARRNVLFDVDLLEDCGVGGELLLVLSKSVCELTQSFPRYVELG